MLLKVYLNPPHTPQEKKVYIAAYKSLDVMAKMVSLFQTKTIT